MAAQGDGDTPAIDPEKEEPKEAEGEDSEEDITDKGDEDAQSKPADDSEKTEQADITVEVDVNIGGADSVPDTGGDTPDGGKPRPPPVEANPAKSLMGNTPIKFVNETGETDNTVVVFLKNEDPNAIATPFVAWRTIRTQSSASFSYPTESEVGALYEEDGMKMTAGPLPAHPGSTWEFLQETEHATPTLKEDVQAAPNPEGSIVVKNMQPKLWPGRMFNFGIYKDGKLCATQHDVGVGSQAVFKYEAVLFFGVVRELSAGTVFQNLSMTTHYYRADLSKFPSGMIISLTKNHSSGEYRFTALAVPLTVGILL